MVAEETLSEAHQLQHGIGNLRATATDTSGTTGIPKTTQTTGNAIRNRLKKFARIRNIMKY